MPYHHGKKMPKKSNPKPKPKTAKKGSAAMKAKMAKLRAMKGKK